MAVLDGGANRAYLALPRGAEAACRSHACLSPFALNDHHAMRRALLRSVELEASEFESLPILQRHEMKLASYAPCLKSSITNPTEQLAEA